METLEIAESVARGYSSVKYLLLLGNLLAAEFETTLECLEIASAILRISLYRLRYIYPTPVAAYS